MRKMVKKTLSDRIIASDTNINQFYCEKCKYASNKLYIVDGYSHCEKCTPTKNLPVYNQNRERIV